ncbi:hypothetical protein PsYK624_076280 [Phanerochaete sordida]|uniref:Uncharacterized protein n=1 Tax=Phanerochaete sordida TaxID=48140 RepID=A0A9P3GAS6_9APHY|nr:hypothetical protein PsYK624_076280 [Phanerochaete sordida]
MLRPRRHDEAQIRFSLTVERAVASAVDLAISPADAAAKIVETVCDAYGSRVVTPAARKSGYDCPGWFLDRFWGILMPMVVHGPPEMQGRSIDFLRELKKHGRAGCDGMRTEWGEAVDWGRPTLFDAIAGSMLDEDGPSAPKAEENLLPRQKFAALRALSGAPQEDRDDPYYYQSYAKSRVEWLNIVRYFMQIWALDICDLEIYGLRIMRDGLENVDLAEPKRLTKAPDLVPPALALEAASVCVRLVGKKMYRSTRIVEQGDCDLDYEFYPQGYPGRGGQRWTGVEGYHPDRWKLWKSVFIEYAEAEGRRGIVQNAVEAAKAAIEAMEAIESVDVQVSD